MSVDQASQQLGIAKGAIQESQEQFQRVTAGHQATHEALQTVHREMNLLRDQLEIGGAEELDARLVREEERPELEDMVTCGKRLCWSGKQALKNAENREKPNSVLNFMHFGVTREMGQELQHFLTSRTEREARGVIRGAERETCLEQWRRLSALYDPLAAGRRLDDSRQTLFPPTVTKRDEPSHARSKAAPCRRVVTVCFNIHGSGALR